MKMNRKRNRPNQNQKNGLFQTVFPDKFQIHLWSYDQSTFEIDFLSILSDLPQTIDCFCISFERYRHTDQQTDGIEHKKNLADEEEKRNDIIHAVFINIIIKNLCQEYVSKKGYA